MPTWEETQDVLYSAITTAIAEAEGLRALARSEALLNLAEAFAWTVQPGQSHGGGRTTVKTG